MGFATSHACVILLLGPVGARIEGHEVQIGSVKQRALLARVALSAPDVVSLDRLVETLWEDDPPDNARGNIQSYVSRLRAQLGEKVLVHAHGGYQLGEAVVDVQLAGDAAARARVLRPKDAAAAIAGYDEALAWWRGPTLVDLAAELEFVADAARLDDLRDKFGDERDKTLM